MKRIQTFVLVLSILSITWPELVSAEWKHCAREGGTCSFDGTKVVRYGSGNTFVKKTFTNGVSCSNNVFGDPTFGVPKDCWYDDEDESSEENEASKRAPKNVSTRRLGFSTDALGPDAKEIEALGEIFYYEQGMFWQQQGGNYIAVAAPVGASVPALPRAAEKIATKTSPLWYFHGAFLQENGDSYTTIRPPVGIQVTYLPDGYIKEKMKDIEIYRYGTLAFQAILSRGTVVYQVVEP